MIMSSLLGFLDEPIKDEKTVNSHTSKIGGQPVVAGGHTIKITCSSCSKMTCVLVCQIYCPVDELYHRTLYIFCCPRPQCHKSNQGWKVLRVQQIAEEQQPNQAPPVVNKQSDLDWGTDEADDWGAGDSNDWGDSVPVSQTDSWSQSTPVYSQSTDKLPVEQTPPPVDVNELVSSVEGLSIAADTSVSDYVYDSYYISVIEEASSASGGALDKESKQLLQKYEKEMDKREHFETKGGAGSTRPCKESYEKASIAHGDKTFYKFTKTLSSYPSQIIRYDFGGESLPMVPLDTTHISSCGNCGAQRIFEVQLMPALLQSLTVNGDIQALDIGAVIIYSCAKNCWSGKTCVEYVVVQNDPDEHLLNKKF